MNSSPVSAKRAPQQDRSRQSWERALRVGMQLFEEHGWSGLTISEVCRRADISAPSLYARVDGKAGLFLAVHERWLTEIARTEEELSAAYIRPGATPHEAAASAARVVMGVFETHRRALHAVIDRSTQDSQLLQRGSQASTEFLERLAATIKVPQARATAAVRGAYAECLLRTMFGPSFLLQTPEPDDHFHSRVIALTQAIAGTTPDSP